jgi:hypothetical protein
MTTASLSSRAATARLAAEIEANRPIPEWDSVPELKKWREEITLKGEKKKLTFDQMITKYKDVDAEIKYREAIKKELKTAIESGMIMADIDNCMCEGYKVAFIEKAGSKKIEANKLLELGVSADTIAKATVTGSPVVYVDIRQIKESKI